MKLEILSYNVRTAPIISRWIHKAVDRVVIMWNSTLFRARSQASDELKFILTYLFLGRCLHLFPARLRAPFVPLLSSSSVENAHMIRNFCLLRYRFLSLILSPHLRAPIDDR